MTTWVNPHRIRVDVLDYLRSNGASASPVLVRLLRNLPSDSRAAFTIEQLDLLAAASQSPSTAHVIDYRASVPFMGQRYYVRLLAGHEKRNMRRLVEEKQVGFEIVAIFSVVVGWIVLTLLIAFAALALYLLKSALGIDLLDGPSILHDLFFH